MLSLLCLPVVRCVDSLHDTAGLRPDIHEKGVHCEVQVRVVLVDVGLA